MKVRKPLNSSEKNKNIEKEKEKEVELLIDFGEH